GDDLVELAPNLRAAHAENRAVQEDVLASGQLRMKSGADFEQRSHASAHDRLSGGRIRDAREHFEQGALSRPVASDDADDLAFGDLERHVIECGVPPFAAPSADAQRILNDTDTLFGYEHLSGDALYTELDNDPMKKAGFL